MVKMKMVKVMMMMISFPITLIICHRSTPSIPYEHSHVCIYLLYIHISIKQSNLSFSGLTHPSINQLINQYNHSSVHSSIHANIYHAVSVTLMMMMKLMDRKIEMSRWRYRLVDRDEVNNEEDDRQSCCIYRLSSYCHHSHHHHHHHGRHRLSIVIINIVIFNNHVIGNINRPWHVSDVSSSSIMFHQISAYTSLVSPSI